MKLRYLYILSVCYLLAHLLVSCANKGMGPQGGPKDETPPVIKQELPLNRSVNFAGNQLVITCDEYLQLKDAANQVFVSPPMRRAPVVKAVGKKVTVTFDEPLRDSTTYVIDFGKAICDLNEGNPLEGYSFTFSTGPVIDTLQMSGVLINANDLNPVQNMMIGIHDDLRDSAFLEKTFVAIARTDEQGAFTLRNLHAGKYHIYALNDVSKDYVYQPGEGLAFLDTLFTPIAIDTFVLAPLPADSLHPDSLAMDSMLALLGPYMKAMMMDSASVRAALLGDSLQAERLHAQIPEHLLDSFLLQSGLKAPLSSPLNGEDQDPLLSPLNGEDSAADSLALLGERVSASADGKGALKASLVKQTRYLPDDIVLRYFSEDKRRMYFVRCLREEAHCFKLLFASPQDTMPRFTDLPPCFIQSTSGMDTVTVWLQDSAYIRQDTIDFTMTYQLTDSVYNIRWQTDSLRAIYRAPRLTPQMQAAQEREKQKALKEGKKPVLEFKHNASPNFEIYDRLRLTFPLPLQSWPGGVGAPTTPPAPLIEGEDQDPLLSPLNGEDSVAVDSINRAQLDNQFHQDSSAAQQSIDSAFSGITLFRIQPKPAPKDDKVLALLGAQSSSASRSSSLGEKERVSASADGKGASADGLGASSDTIPLEDFSLVKLDSCGSEFAVDYAWEGGAEYVLKLDSAAFTSIYGVSTKEQQIGLKVRSAEDYATLIMRAEPFDPRLMIQVLDSKEQVVRTLRADTAGARFEFLKPESYYVRAYIDENGDSVWTTGDWLTHRQPEPVYYFPNKVTLKANWDFEETLLYLDKSILEQKPTEIKKAIDYGKKK